MQIRGRNRHFNDHGFGLDRKEFEAWYESQPKMCVYCDLPENLIPFLNERYNSVSRRLTIDCKDNDVGYRIDNIVLACHKCNFIKSNLFTHDEMVEIADKYLKPKLDTIRQKASDE